MKEPRSTAIEVAQRLARRELTRRFYKEATVARRDGGFTLLLDGRVARTPARKPIVVEHEAVADALAAEWGAQGETLDPARMPMTRIVNAAIDRVAGEMAAVRADVAKYSGTDLICYRSDGPQSLVAAEEAAWLPLVAWAWEAFHVRLNVTEGIVHVAQGPEVAEAVAAAIAPLDAMTLAALHTATTLTGSAMIALAVLRRRLSPEAAWAAAHVDEDWQMSQWGRDETALANRAVRKAEFDAVAVILAAAGSSDN